MITPVGKKYYNAERDKLIKVIDYENVGLGMIALIYIVVDNGKAGRIPVSVFRKKYVRYNNYTQQKQKLKI